LFNPVQFHLFVSNTIIWIYIFVPNLFDIMKNHCMSCLGAEKPNKTRGTYFLA